MSVAQLGAGPGGGDVFASALEGFPDPGVDLEDSRLAQAISWIYEALTALQYQGQVLGAEVGRIDGTLQACFDGSGLPGTAGGNGLRSFATPQQQGQALAAEGGRKDGALQPGLGSGGLPGTTGGDGIRSSSALQHEGGAPGAEDGRKDGALHGGGGTPCSTALQHQGQALVAEGGRVDAAPLGSGRGGLAGSAAGDDPKSHGEGPPTMGSTSGCAPPLEQRIRLLEQQLQQLQQLCGAPAVPGKHVGVPGIQDDEPLEKRAAPVMGDFDGRLQSECTEDDFNKLRVEPPTGCANELDPTQRLASEVQVMRDRMAEWDEDLRQLAGRVDNSEGMLRAAGCVTVGSGDGAPFSRDTLHFQEGFGRHTGGYGAAALDNSSDAADAPLHSQGTRHHREEGPGPHREGHGAHAFAATDDFADTPPHPEESRRQRGGSGPQEESHVATTPDATGDSASASQHPQEGLRRQEGSGLRKNGLGSSDSDAIADFANVPQHSQEMLRRHEERLEKLEELLEQQQLLLRSGAGPGDGAGETYSGDAAATHADVHCQQHQPPLRNGAGSGDGADRKTAAAHGRAQRQRQQQHHSLRNDTGFCDGAGGTHSRSTAAVHGDFAGRRSPLRGSPSPSPGDEASDILRRLSALEQLGLAPGRGVIDDGGQAQSILDLHRGHSDLHQRLLDLDRRTSELEECTAPVSASSRLTATGGRHGSQRRGAGKASEGDEEETDGLPAVVKALQEEVSALRAQARTATDTAQQTATECARQRNELSAVVEYIGPPGDSPFGGNDSADPLAWLEQRVAKLARARTANRIEPRLHKVENIMQEVSEDVRKVDRGVLDLREAVRQDQEAYSADIRNEMKELKCLAGCLEACVPRETRKAIELFKRAALQRADGEQLAPDTPRRFKFESEVLLLRNDMETRLDSAEDLVKRQCDSVTDAVRGVERQLKMLEYKITGPSPSNSRPDSQQATLPPEDGSTLAQQPLARPPSEGRISAGSNSRSRMNARPLKTPPSGWELKR